MPQWLSNIIDVCDYINDIYIIQWANTLLLKLATNKICHHNDKNTAYTGGHLCIPCVVCMRERAHVCGCVCVCVCVCVSDGVERMVWVREVKVEKNRERGREAQRTKLKERMLERKKGRGKKK